MKPLIVHLTVVHRPDDVRILVKECASLVRAGYEVVLVAPGIAPDETYGVAVHTIERSRGRLGRLFRTQWQLYKHARKLPASVFHFHDPELIVSAWFLRRRARVIYDVHENFAAQVRTRPWIPRLLRPLIAEAVGLVEHWSSKRWSGIVTATDDIARQFPHHETVVTVRNYPRLEEFPGSQGVRREAVAAYVGDVTAIRGAREMVEAIGRTTGIVLEVAGRFSPPSLEAELHALPGWSRIQWRGWLARHEVAELLARAAAGLLLLHPVRNNLDGRPGKLFEYMAAGLPVVASDFPGWRPIVADTGAGLLVDPLDTAAIAQAIEWIVSHPEEAAEMGRRGADAVQCQFNWGREETHLTELYRRMLYRA
jgi:glycosyltransferase involved in cell wall biosynthesis